MIKEDELLHWAWIEFTILSQHQIYVRFPVRLTSRVEAVDETKVGPPVEERESDHQDDSVWDQTLIRRPGRGTTVKVEIAFRPDS